MRTTGHGRAALLLACVGLLMIGVVGCGESEPPQFDYHIEEDGAGSWVEMEGVRFDFEVPVVHKIIALSNRTRVQSVGAGRSLKTVRMLEEHYFNVRGDWLKIENGVLAIGAARYGTVVAGDRVRIEAARVLVNGVERPAEK